MMRYTTRPLSDRTWLRPAGTRVSSPFSATWTGTRSLLARELGELAARDVVLEVDVPERGIRNDGQLRADARIDEPAVVLAFESRHGPMLYRCDRYAAGRHRNRGDSWQHNVRAIALTLEALRAVDRYGAVETGQQYTGFKQLGAGTPLPASQMTEDEAWAIIGSYADLPIAEQRRRHTAGETGWARNAYRRARAANHPDRHGGDRTLWDQVEQAARVLGVTS